MVGKIAKTSVGPLDTGSLSNNKLQADSFESLVESHKEKKQRKEMPVTAELPASLMHFYLERWPSNPTALKGGQQHNPVEGVKVKKAHASFTGEAQEKGRPVPINTPLAGKPGLRNAASHTRTSNTLNSQNFDPYSGNAVTAKGTDIVTDIGTDKGPRTDKAATHDMTITADDTQTLNKKASSSVEKLSTAMSTSGPNALEINLLSSGTLAKQETLTKQKSAKEDIALEELNLGALSNDRSRENLPLAQAKTASSNADLRAFKKAVHAQNNTLQGNKPAKLDYPFQRWSGDHSVKVTLAQSERRDGNIFLQPSDMHTAQVLTSQVGYWPEDKAEITYLNWSNEEEQGNRQQQQDQDEEQQ